MSEAVFIDTWGWLALGHRRDSYHQKIKDFYQALKAHGVRLSTTDYVLDEAITLVFRREVYEEAVRFMEGIFEAGQQAADNRTDHAGAFRFSLGTPQAPPGQAEDFLYRPCVDGGYERTSYQADFDRR